MTEQERWEEISNYSQSYYEGHPEISDAEFDVLYDNFIKDFSSFQEISGKTNKTDKILLNNVTRVFKIRKKQRYNNYIITL